MYPIVRAPLRYAMATLPVASAARVSRYFWPDQEGGMKRFSRRRNWRVSTIARLASRGRQVFGSTQLPPLEASHSAGKLNPM
jgi:hypothetical protein